MPKGVKVFFHFSLVKRDNVVPIPGQNNIDKINFVNEKKILIE